MTIACLNYKLHNYWSRKIWTCAKWIILVASKKSIEHIIILLWCILPNDMLLYAFCRSNIYRKLLRNARFEHSGHSYKNRRKKLTNTSSDASLIPRKKQNQRTTFSDLPHWREKNLQNHIGASLHTASRRGKKRQSCRAFLPHIVKSRVCVWSVINQVVIVFLPRIVIDLRHLDIEIYILLFKTN